MSKKDRKIEEVINDVKEEDIKDVPEVDETEETEESVGTPRVITDEEWEKIQKDREKEAKRASKGKISPKKILVGAGAVGLGIIAFLAGKEFGRTDDEVEYIDVDGDVSDDGDYETTVAQETENYEE